MIELTKTRRLEDQVQVNDENKKLRYEINELKWRKKRSDINYWFLVLTNLTLLVTVLHLGIKYVLPGA